MKLYSYWRSGTSHRTRIALRLKELTYETVPIDLRKGAHKQPGFLSLNPQGLVPALELLDGTLLTQSPAIIEYLEDAYPTPPLLPLAATDRAKVRAMAAIIGCDTHPLNNLRVLNYQKMHYQADEKAIHRWITTWIDAAFKALESLIETHAPDGRFCFGDSPTIADCYLIPQIYSARRFNVDLSAFTRLLAIDEACHTIEAFNLAHPDQQPDAD